MEDMELNDISIDGLPAGISEDILLRLPVKKLLQVKCVCKQWRRLIETRGFIDRHHRHHSNIDNLLIGVFRQTERGNLLRSRSQHANNNNYLDAFTEFMGPVHGLLCKLVVREKVIYLLNPATRMMKSVTIPPLLPNLHLSSLTFGFGSDPITGGCKVVVFHRDHNDESKNFVCVYRLITDSWNFIEAVGVEGFENSTVNACWSNSKAFLNGVHYWLVAAAPVEGGGSPTDFSILAFDMSRERFREIQPPRGFRRLQLSVFECPKLQSDRLAALVQIVAHGDSSIALLSNEREWVDMWVMGKEEGSWTQKFRVCPPNKQIIATLCMWANEVVLDTGNDSCLTLCDVSTQRVRSVELPSNRRYPFLHSAFSFKDSLVSIKGEETFTASFKDLNYHQSSRYS